MVEMDAWVGHREAGDRRALASGRLSVLLALAFSPPTQPTENHLRTSETHPLDGSGESDLGSAQDPRRALEAGIRNIRIHRFPVSCPNRPAQRIRQGLARNLDCVNSLHLSQVSGCEFSLLDAAINLDLKLLETVL
jgi:hypothetical protein